MAIGATECDDTKGWDYLGPDVGQGAQGVSQGVYLKLAPEHGRRQQHANDANQESADNSALHWCMVLLERITSKIADALRSSNLRDDVMLTTLWL